MPANLQPGDPALTRARIDSGALAGRGLELGWVRSPADLYYLQMQGSGRLILDDGRMVRLGYGGQNGHPRRSVSAEAVRRGILRPHQASARMVRAWVAANPEAGRALVQADPSYVFFRRIEGHPARLGPLGAIGVPLTPRCRNGACVATRPLLLPNRG
jgi:membrane-bound lytic murein transglycosylase A